MGARVKSKRAGGRGGSISTGLQGKPGRPSRVAGRKFPQGGVAKQGARKTGGAKSAPDGDRSGSAAPGSAPGVKRSSGRRVHSAESRSVAAAEGLSVFSASRWLGLAARAPVAALAVGPIAPGFHRFFLSNGAISPVDVVAYVLGVTGPADVTITTWTIGPGEAAAAWRLVGDGRIRSFRLLVDASLSRREPAYLSAVVDRFGAASVRLARCHAKIAVIRNASWSVVLRGSANWTRAPRLEFYEVSDDPALADYLLRVLGVVLEAPAAGSDSDQEFERWMAAIDPEAGRAFLDGSPFGRDVRRVGVSYLK